MAAAAVYARHSAIHSRFLILFRHCRNMTLQSINGRNTMIDHKISDPSTFPVVWNVSLNVAIVSPRYPP